MSSMTLYSKDIVTDDGEHKRIEAIWVKPIYVPYGSGIPTYEVLLLYPLQDGVYATEKRSYLNSEKEAIAKAKRWVRELSKSRVVKINKYKRRN